MIRLACLFMVFTTSAWATDTLPSGLEVTLHDVLVEKQPNDETWLVLRYVSTALSTGNITYGDVVEDMSYLCETDGLHKIESLGGHIAQINVILMDKPIPRGTATPGSVQYIGAYLPIPEGCAWNDF